MWERRAELGSGKWMLTSYYNCSSVTSHIATRTAGPQVTQNHTHVQDPAEYLGRRPDPELNTLCPLLIPVLKKAQPCPLYIYTYMNIYTHTHMKKPSLVKSQLQTRKLWPRECKRTDGAGAQQQRTSLLKTCFVCYASSLAMRMLSKHQFQKKKKKMHLFSRKRQE